MHPACSHTPHRATHAHLLLGQRELKLDGGQLLLHLLPCRHLPPERPHQTGHRRTRRIEAADKIFAPSVPTAYIGQPQSPPLQLLGPAPPPLVGRLFIAAS